MPSITLNAIRKRAQRKWLTVHRLRDGSRYYWEYGPYYVVDADTNAIINYGIVDLEDLAAYVDGEPTHDPRPTLV